MSLQSGTNNNFLTHLSKTLKTSADDLKIFARKLAYIIIISYLCRKYEQLIAKI